MQENLSALKPLAPTQHRSDSQMSIAQANTILLLMLVFAVLFLAIMGNRKEKT